LEVFAGALGFVDFAVVAPCLAFLGDILDLMAD
jgi:hypothetical protein